MLAKILATIFVLGMGAIVWAFPFGQLILKNPETTTISIIGLYIFVFGLTGSLIWTMAYLLGKIWEV